MMQNSGICFYDLRHNLLLPHPRNVYGGVEMLTYTICCFPYLVYRNVPFPCLTAEGLGQAIGAGGLKGPRVEKGDPYETRMVDPLGIPCMGSLVSYIYIYLYIYIYISIFSFMLYRNSGDRYYIYIPDS